MNRKMEKGNETEFKFRLPKDLKEDFKEACKANGDYAADILRGAIKQYLTDSTKMKVYTIKKDGDITTVIGSYKGIPYIMDINKDGSFYVTNKLTQEEKHDVYNKYINKDYIKLKE